MARTRSRLLVLAVMAGVMVVPGPAVAQESEPVSELRVKVAGAVELSALADAGIDVEHDVTRVPDGIEAEVHATKAQELQILAMGGEIVDEAFAWNFATSKSLLSEALPRPAAPTVRVVRADYFSTKGQGFLYVEARTTQGAQTTPVVTMQLENNTSTNPAFGSPRSDEPLRGLGRLHVPPQPVQGRRREQADGDPGALQHGRRGDRQGLAVARRGRHPADRRRRATSPTSSTATSIRSSSTAGSSRSRPSIPQIAEIVPLPNKTNGYQRKAQATIGPAPTNAATPAQSTVVVSSAAWGHEGGNGITVEMIEPAGREPAAVGRGRRQGREGPAGQERGRRARQHRQAGRGRDRGGRRGPDRPRAPVPHQRGHGHRPGDDDADRPHRLPGRQSAPVRPRARSRAARTRSARCGSASTVTAASRAC